MRFIDNISAFYEANYIWILGIGVGIVLMLTLIAVFRSISRKKTENFGLEGIESDINLTDEVAKEPLVNKESVHIEEKLEAVEESYFNDLSAGEESFEEETFMQGNLHKETFKEKESDELSVKEKDKEVLLEEVESALENGKSEKLFNIKIEHANLVIDRIDSIENLEKDWINSKLKSGDFGQTKFGSEVAQALDRALSQEESTVRGDKKDIVLEKINIIRSKEAKKYGVHNLNVNRKGREFTEEELIAQIRD